MGRIVLISVAIFLLAACGDTKAEILEEEGADPQIPVEPQEPYRPAWDYPGAPSDLAENQRWVMDMINAGAMWEIMAGYECSAVHVGLLDNGADLSMSDLAGKNANQQCERLYERIEVGEQKPRNANTRIKDHAVRVAESAFACSNNGVMGAGVNLDSPLTFFDVAIAEQTIRGGMQHVLALPASDMPKVLNLSLTPGAEFREEMQYKEWESIAQAMRQVDTVFVSAAGNSGTEEGNSGFEPFFSQSALIVGGLARDGRSFYHSAWGEWVDVLAPAEKMPRLLSEDTISGTSYAAPLVSAVLANMRCVCPSLGLSELREIVRETARPVSAEDYCDPLERKNNKMPQRELCLEHMATKRIPGILDAGKALMQAQKRCTS